MNQWLRRRLPTPEQVGRNRWLRWLGPSLLHPRLWHMSRRGIAAGAGIGVFFAFLIPIAQIPLSVGTAVVLRANIPVAIASTLVNNPLTFPPVYYAAWKVGSALLGEEADEANAPVKSALRRFSRAQAMALLAEVAHMDDARAIRACVEERLRREGVPVRVRI